VDVLLAGGADANARCADGTAPLRQAARHGHAAVARLLLARGAATELRGEEEQARRRQARPARTARVV
jgi:ankyrin repeat protein